MKTDYTNCHPEIAELLKKGEHIECIVWDNKEGEFGDTPTTIGMYVKDSLFPYNGEKEQYKHAKPIPKKVKRVLGLVAMMQALVDRGYKPDKVGAFLNNSVTRIFYPDMWQHCGVSPSATSIIWDSWMIEEVKE